MSNNPVLANLNASLAMVPEGAAVALVFVNRYGVAGPIGLHAVYATPDEPVKQGHFTVGLFDGLDVVKALEALGLVRRVIFPLPFSEHGPALQAYIRARCIPLEWKSHDQAMLDRNLIVMALPDEVVARSVDELTAQVFGG